MSDARTWVGRTEMREVEIRAEQIDPEARTVELAFSSEQPVDRNFFGDVWREILDHSPDSVDLSRMRNGAALLVGHDHTDQVGVVESARVDADRKGRAVVRFSRSARGQEIFQDVIDGIRRLVSVGYSIDAAREDDADVPTVRVTEWTPLEVSLVSVPADVTVGVGRSADEMSEMAANAAGRRESDESDSRSHQVRGIGEDHAMSDHDESAAADERAEEVTETTTETTEVIEHTNPANERTATEIRRLAARYDMTDHGEMLIDTNGTIDEMQQAVREKVAARPAPEPVPAVRAVRVEGGAPRYRQMRAFKSEASAYRSGMWAKAIIYGDQKAARWCNENGVRAMGGDVLSKGGALVPEEMSQAIIDNREQFGIARRLCNVVPMNSDTLIVPQRAGSVTTYFSGDNDALTASDQSWEDVQLVARKLHALTRVSTELVEDAVIDLADFLAMDMAQRFAETEDDCLWNGDGTSTYGGIVGIRPKIIDGTHTAGAVDVATATHDTFAEIDNDDLTTAMAAAPQYAQSNARWFISQPGNALVFEALKAAGGGNTVITLGQRTQAAYLGYPIEVSQKMPTSTGSLDALAMLLYGDLSRAAIMGDRRGFRLQVLSERYADNDQIGVKATERFDIVAHDLGDNTTAGPIVALIGSAS